MEYCTPCNDLTFFELCAARNWAMYVLKSHVNVKLVLDVTNTNKTSRWFLLNDIPQIASGVKLDYWHGVQKENEIEYTNTNNDSTSTTLHIRSFISSRFPSLYVSLYDMDTGIRFAPLCLIIWERNHPEVSNQGYAEGRCPNEFKI